jgi:FkbM family methyltransferase
MRRPTLNSLWLKRRLVGTRLGRTVMRCRNVWSIWQSMRANPENLGSISQEACAKQLLPGLCLESTVFVDVGAHIGSVIDLVRQRHPTIKVIAIEAVPDKATQLAKKFRNIEVHNCAVGEAEGDVTFFVDLHRPGYSSLARGGRAATEVREIQVPMRRLDQLVPATDRVSLMKLDVEGAELAVLRGAAELIARCRPVIYFESGRRATESLGYTTEALFDWFAAAQYEILVPNRVAHNGPGLGRDGFVEAHYYPVRTGNYFAIPAERRTEIRDRAREVLGIVPAARDHDGGTSP